MPASTRVWFATSNPQKFQEAEIVLQRYGVGLKRLPAKGTEVQSDDVAVVARRSALESWARWRRPLFVEDTGLFVRALNGFPGPYASYLNRTLGPSALLTLLGEEEERDAVFVAALAYCTGAMPRIFRGRLRGTISREARGNRGFGFDPVFVPEGKRRTLAEMSVGEKTSISHRTLALKGLGEWLGKEEDR